MFTPTVTEIHRRLEPITHDTFIEVVVPAPMHPRRRVPVSALAAAGGRRGQQTFAREAQPTPAMAIAAAG